ncbi:Genome sequencing data, contig C288 [Microcystis aeruginosa PCC 7941]|nr:Genome sequencing data, contig C288 [Microcystis aeruginosa PCC 7941]
MFSGSIMAKKSKAFSELPRLQKMSQGSEKPLKSFEKKLREKSLPFKEIVVSPSGEVTMSEVLEDFIEPYRKSNETKGSMRTLLTIGIIAWNLALSPESKRQEMIDRVFNKDLLKGDKRLKADIQGLIDELIARKNRYFSENKRMIVDFELKELGSEYHLSVASSLSPEFSESEFAFKVGDSVIVKQGVLDPDLGTDIGGWQGRIVIIERQSNLIGIEWDSITLKNIPSSVIDQCELENLDWAQMYLSSTDVELTQPRDTEEDVAAIIEQIQSNIVEAI